MIARSALLALTLSFLSLLACTRSDPVYNSRILAFGTLVDVSILGVPRDKAEWAASELEADFTYMHHAWHAWEPGPLSRTNQLLATGEAFAAPPSVLPLIERSKVLATLSDDLFNPAIGALIARWGFHSDLPQCVDPPSDEEIAELVALRPRMSDISIEGIVLRSSNPAVQLDFGGIAKGYGIDKAIEHLREMGIENAIVNAGGDLRAIGSRDGQPWRIAIRRPSGTGVFATVEVQGDESVFTSGDYERSYACDGNSYHHIIDPRTGYPAQGTHAVTVLHRDAATADAAATALFVAGPERWYEIARRMGIQYVLLVDTRGTLHMNPAMKARLTFLDPAPHVHLSPPLSGADDPRS
jgi:thiamine biosynthesis lipoprotein